MRTLRGRWGADTLGEYVRRRLLRRASKKWLNEWKGTWTSLLVGPEEVEALELLGEEVEQEDAISTQAADDGDLGSLAGVRSDAEPQ